MAHAIESGNTRFLVDLPQIGKRMAETIIATLSGKLGSFVVGPIDENVRPAVGAKRSSEDEIAIGIVCGPQIGLRRVEAESLLDRVRRTNPKLSRAEEFVPEMLKLHAG